MHSSISLFDNDIELTSSQVEKSQKFRMELAKLIERTYLLGFSLPINDSVTSKTTLSNIALEFEFLRDQLLNNEKSDKNMGFNIDDNCMEDTINTDEDSEEIERKLRPYLRTEPSISHLRLKPLRCPSKKISKKKSCYRLSSIYTLNPLITDPEIYCDDFDNLDYLTASELDNGLGSNQKSDSQNSFPDKNRYYNTSTYLSDTINSSIGSHEKLKHSREIGKDNVILPVMNDNIPGLKPRARCNSLPETPLLDSNLSVFSDLTNLSSSVTSNHDTEKSFSRKRLRHCVSCSAELSHMTLSQEIFSMPGKSKNLMTYNRGQHFRKALHLFVRRKKSINSNISTNEIGFDSDILSLSSKKSHYPYETIYANRNNGAEGSLEERQDGITNNNFLALDTSAFQYPNSGDIRLRGKFHNPILDVTINFPRSPVQAAETVYSIPDRRRLSGNYNHDVTSIQLLHNTLENDKMNSRNPEKNFKALQSFIPPIPHSKKSESSIRRRFCNNGFCKQHGILAKSGSCSSSDNNMSAKTNPKLIRSNQTVTPFPYRDRTNGGSHSLIWIKANQMFVSHGEKTLTKKPLISAVKHDSLREALSHSIN